MRSGAPRPRPPRLIDFSWGDDAAPKVTLVGKGVTFDTGGLNIKPDAAMLLMKKDMGGAATALAAAAMVMARICPCGCACSCRRSRTPSRGPHFGRATCCEAARG